MSLIKKIQFLKTYAFDFFFSMDNSEFMRNGDFLPTRLQAQQDAVGLITQSKLRSNPESNVGLMTLSGLEGEEFLITCYIQGPRNRGSRGSPGYP